jgi:hypothetical protein
MAAGNPILRKLDCSRESWQRNCQQPGSTWMAKTKRHPSRQKDKKMFKTVCGPGCWPDGWRAERQDDNGRGEQPGRSLKDLLHMALSLGTSSRLPASIPLPSPVISDSTAGSCGQRLRAYWCIAARLFNHGIFGSSRILAISAFSAGLWRGRTGRAIFVWDSFRQGHHCFMKLRMVFSA